MSDMDAVVNNRGMTNLLNLFDQLDADEQYSIAVNLSNVHLHSKALPTRDVLPLRHPSDEVRIQMVVTYSIINRALAEDDIFEQIFAQFKVCLKRNFEASSNYYRMLGNLMDKFQVSEQEAIRYIEAFGYESFAALDKKSQQEWFASFLENAFPLEFIENDDESVALLQLCFLDVSDLESMCEDIDNDNAYKIKKILKDYLKATLRRNDDNE